MLASLSIDLDALEHYHRIHGLERRTNRDDPVYGKSVERFGELCDRLGVRGTAFCVGVDLARPGAAPALRRLALAGHELGNHSLSHDYALSRRSPPEIAAEVRGGAEAIRAVAGAAPVGFRAPGYTLSRELLAALVEQGYRYDSSTFPTLPYWLGKAGVMGALALGGRPSQAILDRPRVLLAPRRPYHPHPDEPYAHGPMPLLELPVATGLLGFPLTGTFVATFPAWSLGLLRAGTGARPLFALELHGLDLLDASDASPALAARQRDLRIPASAKIERLVRFARALAGREWVTLAQAAERLSA